MLDPYQMAEVSFSQPMPVEERIPESAKFDKLSAGSVIRGPIYRTRRS